MQLYGRAIHYLKRVVILECAPVQFEKVQPVNPNGQKDRETKRALCYLEFSKLIETCAPGGGYILAGGASATEAPSENLRAFMEAAKEYGVYGSTEAAG